MSDKGALFDTELSKYKSKFDSEYDAVVASIRSNYETKREQFDALMKRRATDFEQYFQVTMKDTFAYFETQRRDLEQLEANSNDAFEKYKYEKLHLFDKQTSLIIDAIPDMCEGGCSFLHGTRLRDEALIYKTKLYHDLLNTMDLDKDYYFMNSIYKALTGVELASNRPEDYLPVLFKIGSVGLLTSVSEKSKYLEVSKGLEYNAFRHSDQEYETAVEVFRSTKLNKRLEEEMYAMSHAIEHFPNLLLPLVLNKYRDALPYLEPNAKMNREFFPPAPRIEHFDQSLASVKTYYTKEGFKQYLSRFVGVFSLSRMQSGGYVCDLMHMGELELKRDCYFPLGCYFETNDDFEITTFRFPEAQVIEESFETEIKPLTYMRIVTSINVYTTLSIHLGVQHLVVADDWNYMFYKHVQSRAPLHPIREILAPLIAGVSDTVDMANLVLANRNEHNYLSVMTNLTSESVLRLTRRHSSDSDLIDERLLAVDSPITNTLLLWDKVFEKFAKISVESVYPSEEELQKDSPINEWLQVVGSDDAAPSRKKLVDVIRAMYMNTVKHEILSNDQLLHDTLDNKLVFSVRNDKSNGLPSAWVHLRTIGTAISTSGDAFRLVDKSLSEYSSITMVGGIFDGLHQDILALATKIESDPQSYSLMLHPKNIECSIAW